MGPWHQQQPAPCRAGRRRGHPAGRSSRCAAERPGRDQIVQFSIAFFATLTGEAVIFVFSFAPSSGWPSLREIDTYIAFREWVLAGWLAAMLTASGLLTHAAIPVTCGALLFLLADALGMFSFVRLFGLASADRRKRLLRRNLAGALARVTATPSGTLPQRMGDDPVLNSYLGQLDEAATRSDGNGVRDLADEMASGSSTASRTAATPTRSNPAGVQSPRCSVTSLVTRH
jgi:hypothetical protein